MAMRNNRTALMLMMMMMSPGDTAGQLDQLSRIGVRGLWLPASASHSSDNEQVIKCAMNARLSIDTAPSWILPPAKPADRLVLDRDGSVRFHSIKVTLVLEEVEEGPI